MTASAATSSPTARTCSPTACLAGIPLLHHNPARTPTVVDLKRDLPGRYSHELNLAAAHRLGGRPLRHRRHQPRLPAHRQQELRRHQVRQLPRTAHRPAADHRRLPPLERADLRRAAELRPAGRQFLLVAADRHRQGASRTGVVSYPLARPLGARQPRALRPLLLLHLRHLWPPQTGRRRLLRVHGGHPAAGRPVLRTLPAGGQDHRRGQGRALQRRAVPPTPPTQTAAEYQLVRSPSTSTRSTSRRGRPCSPR